MNLLEKYLPSSSAHIERFSFSEKDNKFHISFYENPDSMRVCAKIVFEEVYNYNCLTIDKKEDNYIDLAIGFDFKKGQYCLHTSVVEITFYTKNEPKIEIKAYKT